jgi:conjugative transfer signal peptidase TraF
MARPRCRRTLPGGRAALLALVGCSATIAAASMVGSHFLWNLSPSLPRGLYRVHRDLSPTRGALVNFAPPVGAAALIAARGYLPPTASLLKTVIAMPGDRVCISDVFLVNDRAIGTVSHCDTSGRPLQVYRFCDQVPAGWAFVATESPRSFDSRYFGPVPLQSLIVVRPVWTF